jgi:surfactin synthase thioesterase subunit
MVQNNAPSQKINLFCLPFAGGSFYAYRDFQKYADDSVNVIPIDLPGHGRRMGEPLMRDIRQMAEDVFQQIRDNINEPYAIYGHSMGTLLGYLVSQKIVKLGSPAPVHLFFSGRYAPSVPCKERDFHLLPRDQFIRKLMEYGGMPLEVMREQELMDLFVPIMQADFEAVSGYRYEPSAPLDTPITVMNGLSDQTTTYDEALKWQEITTGEVSVKQFPGGHFFIFDHLPEIGRIISQRLLGIAAD